jgi:lactate dehydrogenase-like 2-hydroxyacid dehydrogenase
MRREQSKFVRVLGSYPSDSQLVGPVKDALVALKESKRDERARASALSEDSELVGTAPPKLSIGLIGFGKVGRHLAETLVKHAEVCAIDNDEVMEAAISLGVNFFPSYKMDAFLGRPFDVVILAVPALRFGCIIPK